MGVGLWGTGGPVGEGLWGTGGGPSGQVDGSGNPDSVTDNRPRGIATAMVFSRQSVQLLGLIVNLSRFSTQICISDQQARMYQIKLNPDGSTAFGQVHCQEP